MYAGSTVLSPKLEKFFVRIKAMAIRTRKTKSHGNRYMPTQLHISIWDSMTCGKNAPFVGYLGNFYFGMRTVKACSSAQI